LCKYAGPKPFCWAKPACFDFSSCNFNVQGHVLSAAGDALTTTIIELKFKEQQQQQQPTWVRIKPDTGEKQVGRREQPAADPGYSYPLQLFLFSACLPACPPLPLLLLCTRLDTCNSYKQILRTSECAHFGGQNPQPQDNPNIQWLLLSQPLPLTQQTTEWCQMEMIEYGPEQASCRLGFVDLSSLTSTTWYQISPTEQDLGGRFCQATSRKANLVAENRQNRPPSVCSAAKIAGSLSEVLEQQRSLVASLMLRIQQTPWAAGSSEKPGKPTLVFACLPKSATNSPFLVINSRFLDVKDHVP
jgi:hypothetical protein